MASVDGHSLALQPETLFYEMLHSKRHDGETLIDTAKRVVVEEALRQEKYVRARAARSIGCSKRVIYYYTGERNASTNK